MIDEKVKVTADENGHIIVVSKNNPTFGYIRVQQKRMLVDDKTGFARQQIVSALVPGKVKELKGFGWEDGQEIEGMVRIVEQMHPFNKKEPERDFKLAGKSGVVCTKGDKPIYRKHFWTPKASLEDKEIEHDNDEEIRQAYEEVEVDGNNAEADNFNL